MSKFAQLTVTRDTPSLASSVELLKPITWFAPMWALGCGVVSSGAPIIENWPTIIGAILLAGPLICGTSQAVNDWFDRHVDAINEPGRPIPSGRVPGSWGLRIAIGWTLVSLMVAYGLGLWVFYAALVGLAFAWAYSAPPFRLKRDGWLGNAAVGVCYEGLPWFTGAAALLGTFPSAQIIWLAGLYSVGAHGIMTLNYFKSVEGDRQLGLKSLPARYGIDGAARLACVVMALPQMLVIWLVASWGHLNHAAIIAAGLLIQILLMVRLLQQPTERAAWYNATGTTVYVLGMLTAALAVRGG